MTAVEGVNGMDVTEDDDNHHNSSSHTDSPSLIIPITSSSASTENNFVEIFPEELTDISSSVLMKVLRDENAAHDVWADAAMMYIQQKRARESAAILQEACDRPGGNKEQTVRIYASAGIAHLTQASVVGSSSTKSKGAAGAGAAGAAAADSSDPSEELRALADNRFTHASKVDTLFPMQWIGRGMLNLSMDRLDQARFFFETTLKQCGEVLPALLGMAAVLYHEKDYKGAQANYAKAVRLFPQKSGAATRVGFGLACYRLGQVDRAKAAFARAMEIDPDNVDAMVGSAILDMASLDETSKDFRRTTERAIRMLSTANVTDHSNSMVQNHLANHYFWKWTPVAGKVSVTQGSATITASQPVPLDAGERIRIGTDIETDVRDVGGTSGDDNTTTFTIRDPWKGASETNLKLWKKDYDRVVALAKGAYSSTGVDEIKAEALFHLARVYHIREDMDNAHKFYERACHLSPNLTPARFGLAQTLIFQEEYEHAAAHLRLVLGTSSTATDALAALGLIESREGGKSPKEGLSYLKKAIDLDPLNPDLILLEALALQQRESDYPKALQRYKKAVELIEKQEKTVPFEILTNIGVLCHETKKYDEAFEVYMRALQVLDESGQAAIATLENVGLEGGYIRHADNGIFVGYVNTDVTVAAVPKGEDDDDKDDIDQKAATKFLKVTGPSTAGDDPSSIPLRAGDHVRVGESFETICEEIVPTDGGLSLRIKEPLPSSDSNEADNIVVSVKRENRRLDHPSAISIAFNLARLHESAGRTLAAVELHKAILKRNPAYVNSYLRLACIARDVGSLKECSEWLKIACAVAPGNPEVLTLVGNLHLSLCDWAPAQSVFDQLLVQKVPNAEQYSMLSLATIYFNNLKTPGKYAKHLQYSADYYKRILTKDKANAYAANGLGTILAEKGDLFKAKEIFNRVREVSSDTIADAHLNLGHIYLAQKKHPEALQMYQSYMKKIEDTDAPITSKSRDDDVMEVLLYIAFAYFDWARQTELFNNANAAPADDRYKKCIESLETAMAKSSKENTLLRYNWCMAKLQAANCVLQKLTRNIRRTAQEVADALKGLEDSLPIVQGILQWKDEGKKVLISTSMLQDFITHCKANIESAKSHLEEERKRETEANEIRELQRLEAEAQQKEREYQAILQKEEEAKKQEERDRKAQAKMEKVQQLQQGWEQEAAAAKAASEKRKDKKNKANAPPPVEEDDDIFDNEVPADNTATLFDESDDEDDDDEKKEEVEEKPDESSAEKVDADGEEEEPKTETGKATEKELFGDSSDEDESDEELIPSGTKRGGGETADDEQQNKKRRVLDEED